MGSFIGYFSEGGDGYSLIKIVFGANGVYIEVNWLSTFVVVGALTSCSVSGMRSSWLLFFFLWCLIASFWAGAVE